MPLREDLLNPIEGPNPAGADLTYDTIYDEIQEARREDIPVAQGDWERPLKTADHAQVIKLTSEVLATRSKDLTLAAWLAEAMLHVEGLPGLRQGLDLLRHLLEEFWDHAYPELEDDDSEFRAGPLNWIGSRIDIPVKSTPLNQAGHNLFQYNESRLVPTEDEASEDSGKGERRRAALDDGKLAPEEFDKSFASTPKAWYKELVGGVTGCLAELDALDATCREKFGEYDAPGFVGLRKALQEVENIAQYLLNEKLKVDPDPVEPEPVVAEPGAVGAGSPGGGTAAAPGAGAPAALTPEPTSDADAANRIAVAARYLRRSDPRNPGPYLMLRGLRWGELRAQGTALDPKLLDAPPTHVRKHLKGLLLDGSWEELLDAAEEVMASSHGRGWLDLQRYVLTACESLGGDYEHVAHAVRGALAALIRDLPELPDLTLMDDTPTANAETRAWLRDSVISDEEREAAGLEAGERSVAAVRGGVGGRSAIDRARDKVRAGQPEKAIEVLLKQADRDESERARFLSRSEAAAIMVDAGLGPVALPILRELHEQIQEHNLEEWETGEVVARAMGLLYRCLDSDEYDLRDDLYRRICRLDPLLGMAFNSGGQAQGGDDASGQSDEWGSTESAEQGGEWGDSGGSWG